MKRFWRMYLILSMNIEFIKMQSLQRLYWRDQTLQYKNVYLEELLQLYLWNQVSAYHQSSWRPFHLTKDWKWFMTEPTGPTLMGLKRALGLLFTYWQLGICVTLFPFLNPDLTTLFASFINCKWLLTSTLKRTNISTFWKKRLARVLIHSSLPLRKPTLAMCIIELFKCQCLCTRENPSSQVVVCMPY